MKGLLPITLLSMALTIGCANQPQEAAQEGFPQPDLMFDLWPDGRTWLGGSPGFRVSRSLDERSADLAGGNRRQMTTGYFPFREKL